MKTPFKLILAAFLLIAWSGCSQPIANKNEDSLGEQFKIIATTGQINSALVKLTKGTEAEIQLFCGPGVDPHSFRATTNDVQAMVDADLIVFNGFHLEAKLAEHLEATFRDKSWSMSSAFPVESRLDWVEDGEVDPNAPFDPHIWNHLPAWAKCVESLAERLGELNPENKVIYQANANNYVQEILDAHRWAKKTLSQLPLERRLLVSAHDAFNYFAEAYDMETLAVLGVGNDPEADIQTMRKVATTICDQKVPAIFMESITNPKVTLALKEACDARDWNVEIVAKTLYSDDLGETPPHNSFLGAFRSNVEIITQSLSRQIAP